jgi:hypothetical protein
MWFISFFVILTLMNKEYRKTFFSLETGNEWAQGFFLDGTSDEVRMKILKIEQRKWKKIRPEVKEWVLGNWWRWKDEKPAWFTESLIAKIPDDFIPREEDRVELREMRRRSSFMMIPVTGRRLSTSVAPEPMVIPGPNIARLPEEVEEPVEQKVQEETEEETKESVIVKKGNMVYEDDED